MVEKQQPQLFENTSGSTTIACKVIRHTDKAWFLDCDGDKIWLPKSQVNVFSDAGVQKVSIPDWLYKQHFPNG